MAKRARTPNTFDVEAAVRELRARLLRHGDKARAASEKRYLKSDSSFLGVAVPKIRQEAKAFVREHPGLSRGQLLALAQAVWPEDVHELRGVAIAILELSHAALQAGDLDPLLALLRETRTWAHVDWIATKLMGPIVAREPGAKKKLERWARDDDFWVRRSALLCLHDPLLAGAGDFALFVRLATPMLGEREFFIRKAIGWVLRSTARHTPELTFAYVAEHATEMAGLTFKEATRNLTPKQIATLTALRAR